MKLDFLQWRACVCVRVCFSTCSSLEGVDRSVYTSRRRAVLPRSDLRVQSADVEQHASLLKRQRALTRRHARQRVVPEDQTQHQPASIMHFNLHKHSDHHGRRL